MLALPFLTETQKFYNMVRSKDIDIQESDRAVNSLNYREQQRMYDDQIAIERLQYEAHLNKTSEQLTEQTIRYRNNKGLDH